MSVQNIGVKAVRNCKITAPHNIRQKQGGRQNLCAYQKYRRQSYAFIRKIGAQTLRLLTIWARQNLQLLTSSKSGWRALVQVMLPLVHVVRTSVFCRCPYRRHYVDANILLTTIFCWRQYFVDANNSCRRVYFVSANILLPPMFCWRQYFVATYIFDFV